MFTRPWPFGGRATSVTLAAIALLFLASCGDSPQSPSAAGPKGSAGSDALTTAAAGGTHDDWAAEGISCEECHPCGRRGGHTPSWSDPASPAFHAQPANRNLDSCTVCHGATLDNGVGFAVACGSCHDRNLPAGVTSWKQNCTMCHGGVNDTSGAPPKATWGRASDAVRVGAHATHARASYDCAICHVKPTDALSTGHADGDTATVTFSGVAMGGGTAPAWDRQTGKCASTYCHGATLRGGTNTSPTWTEVGQGQAACGTCHGLPPPPPHTASSITGWSESHPHRSHTAEQARRCLFAG